MARLPYQVLIYPYYLAEDRIEYAIFRRRDNGIWQTVAGGGEGAETPLEAARREAYEEAGIPAEAEFLQLDTVEPIPAVEFKSHVLWGESVYIIPQYCFGVHALERLIHPCCEHTECHWLAYEDAMQRIHYDGNRTALWELNARLTGARPPFPFRKHI